MLRRIKQVHDIITKEVEYGCRSLAISKLNTVVQTTNDSKLKRVLTNQEFKKVVGNLTFVFKPAICQSEKTKSSCVNWKEVKKQIIHSPIFPLCLTHHILVAEM